MRTAVIYATGSPLLVDVEESLYRTNTTVVAGVRNRMTACYLSNPALAITAACLTPDIVGHPFIVPLFTPANRREAVQEALSLGFVHALSVIDPTAIVPRTLAHEQGFYVNAGCTLGAACVFGAFVLINRGATIGHHCRCGPFASIGPGAVISGQVTIGSGACIGAGAVIAPGIRVGDNAVVAAGAVVHRDVPDHTMVAGNPATRAASRRRDVGDRTIV